MIEVAAGERGLVRVFSLSMTDAEAQALKSSSEAQFAALRGEQLNIGHLEIFPLSDLVDIGLTGYLLTGCGLQSEQVEPDRAKLEALEGWVMLVFSKAFCRTAQELHPVPELTLIGTYAEEGVDWTPGQELVSEAAVGPLPGGKKVPSDAAMSGRVASIALGVLFIVTALMIWVAS